MPRPILQLDGYPILDAHLLYQQARNKGYATDHWAHKANSFRLPKGGDPASGYVLLQWSDAQNLQIEQGGHNLTFSNQQADFDVGGYSSSSFFASNLYIKSIKALYADSSNSTSPNTAALVELTDRRHFFAMSSVAKTYNVLAPGAPTTTTTDYHYYDSESLNSGSLWTWTTLFNDLWSKLPGGGSPPSLVYTPSDAPINFSFLGISAWDAILLVLKKLCIGIVYSPYSDLFSTFQEGTDQAGLAILLSSYSPSSNLRSLGDYVASSSQVTRIPEKVRVIFRCVPQHYGAENSTNRVNNYRQYCLHSEDVASGNSNALSGTFQTIQDDMVGFLPPGSTTPANVSALASRAADVAGRWVAQLLESDWSRKSYEGVISNILPGSQIDTVTWQDLGAVPGLITEIQRTPEYSWGKPPLDGSHDETMLPSTTTYPFSSRENKGLPRGSTWGLPINENGASYPHLPHYVIPDGTAGVPTTGSSSSPISGKVVRMDPTAGSLGVGAYNNGEACWIALVNTVTGFNLTSAALISGERYYARLNGSYNNSGDVRPLYLIYRPDNFVEPVTMPSTVSPGSSVSVTLPDGRTVTAKNQTGTTLNSGDKATAYYDWTTQAWYLTGGGTGSNPDNMAIVEAYNATPDATTKLWAGKIVTVSDPHTITIGSDCWLMITNLDLGSNATTAHFTLKVGEPYIGRHEADHAADGKPIYVIRPEDNRLYLIEMPSPITPLAPLAVYTGLVLPTGETVNAVNWSDTVTINSSDHVFVAYDMAQDEWGLWKSGGGSSTPQPFVAILTQAVNTLGSVTLTDPNTGNPVAVLNPTKGGFMIFDEVLCTQDPVLGWVMSLIDGTAEQLEGCTLQDFTKEDPDFIALISITYLGHAPMIANVGGAINTVTVPIQNFARNVQPPWDNNPFVFSGKAKGAIRAVLDRTISAGVQRLKGFTNTTIDSSGYAYRLDWSECPGSPAQQTQPPPSMGSPATDGTVTGLSDLASLSSMSDMSSITNLPGAF